MRETHRQVLSGTEIIQTMDRDTVRGKNELIIVGVSEREREHALLLQVRFVDTGERAGDDSKTAEEAWFESGVFAGGALTVVVVTDDNPLNTVVTVPCSSSRNSAVLASLLVLDFVRLAVLRVDSTDQTVLYMTISLIFRNEGKKPKLRTGDVFKVATVFEPGTTSGDMVGGTLALNLDENREILRCLAIPRLEGFEELKTVRLGVNSNLDSSTVSGWRLEGVLASIIARRY
jgi:hypothetical protein